MNHITPFFLATVCSLGILLVNRQQDSEEPKLAEPKAARLASKKTLARMQGAWRLDEVRLIESETADSGRSRLDHVGYCLVSGNYLSIEFHFRLTPGEDREGSLVMPHTGFDRGRSLVTGLHKFELENGEYLEASTIIGTSIDRYSNPVFEAPGSKRHYYVEIEGDSMTLTRDDGHMLKFERLVDDEKRFDIYGRPARVPDDEASLEEEKKDQGGSEKKQGGG